MQQHLSRLTSVSVQWMRAILQSLQALLEGLAPQRVPAPVPLRIPSEPRVDRPRGRHF